MIIISFTDESYLINHGYSFFQMSGQLRLTSIFFKEPCPIESWGHLGYPCLLQWWEPLLTRPWHQPMLMRFQDLISHTDVFTVYALITMLFAPGMVANYLVVSNLLHLKDTVWALILPMALGPFGILVMRTFFKRQFQIALLNQLVWMGLVNGWFLWKLSYH